MLLLADNENNANSNKKETTMTQNDSTPYVYVIVRHDLSPEQIAVQSGHAIIEAQKLLDDPQGQTHPHLVFCSARNERKLRDACKYLDEQRIRYATFVETDLDNSMTALATVPLVGEERFSMRKFQTLKLKETNYARS